ncbi:acyl carrier protein [Bacillus sp. 31A1R]|uniref:Acyl carrier protein n=1 Tax=Robertmurraya mangrovi TaxID=3098077 RepID=A0ABU5J1S8_9BACI|nr:acyl carrier protein [Bacillus sp. 31A1R]MDZ5473305.1 acyl carrier protein [Bacillus sp. 31A1R]
MMNENFLKELADLLELEVTELKEDYELAENENWDSLALVSVVVMIDEHFQISLKNDVIKNCMYIRDLYSIIENKLNETKV